jgi:hypothetical protein
MSGLRKPPIWNPGQKKGDKAKEPSKEEQARREKEEAARKEKEAAKKKDADSARGFDDKGKISIPKRKGSKTKKPVVNETAGRQGSIHHGKHSVETAGGKLKSLHSMTLGELFKINKG